MSMPLCDVGTQGRAPAVEGMGVRADGVVRGKPARRFSRTGMLVLALVLSRPLLALDVPAGLTHVEVARLDPPTMTVAEAAAGLGRAMGRTPQNILTEGASDAAFLPGAANTSGLFNSFFTTDLFLVNPLPNTIVRLNIFALRPNVNNSANPPPSASVSLGPRSFTTVKNVMGQLGATGGSVLLIGIDAANSQGSPLRFSAWAYTSTAGPSGGRYGVNIQAVGRLNQNAVVNGWNVGVNQGTATRTNFGVFNPSQSTFSVTASIFNPGGTLVAQVPIQVPPVSFQQYALSSYASSVTDGVIVFSAASGDFGSYVVVNDNLTNDANFQLSSAW